MFHERTPLWIVAGGVLLTVIAGWVNAVGVLGTFHEALTHVTGTVTLSALAIVDGDVVAAAHAASLVGAFVVGAAGAGVLIGSPEVKRGRPYSAALVVEAALLAVAWLLMRRGLTVGEHAGAAAAGLQNGLVTTWSGAVLRTSHVTGIATDLGLALGWRARRAPLPDRFGLHAALLAGFCGGAVVGGVCWRAFSWEALLGPVALCLLAAALYAHASRGVRNVDTSADRARPAEQVR